MKLTPEQLRQKVAQWCEALACAATTGNQFVVDATRAAIEFQSARDIPDKPTLADVEAAQKA
jgi:hypothetical protein